MRRVSSSITYPKLNGWSQKGRKRKLEKSVIATIQRKITSPEKLTQLLARSIAGQRYKNMITRTRT
jgi:hypothetical protein